MRRVFAFCALALLALGCEVPVQYGLDEPAANEVVTALERAHIAASKTREGGGGSEATFVVSVNKGQDVSRAIELLRNLGLPRTKRSGLTEVYGQPSLVPSATEERARFQKALSNDIERTMETLDGVVSARVHLVLPESDPLATDSKPRVAAQASVLIKTRPGITLPLRELELQRLVAGAVSGLQPASVAVVVTAAPDWATGDQPTLVNVGPLRMTQSSRVVLFGAVMIVLGVVAVLALVLLLMARRLAAAQRSLSTLRR